MITKSLKPMKRGDTFILTCTSDDSVAAATITSQIRTDCDALVADLTVTKTSATSFTLTFPTGTDTWPIGVHVCDLQIVDAGTTRSTDTFYVPIISDVTR